MSPTLKVTLFLMASMSLVLMQVPASYFLSKNWSPDQLLTFWQRPGVPLKYHLGWWGDLLVLPALFAWAYYKYGDSWVGMLLVVMLGVGFLFNLGNHIGLITGQTFVDPYGHPGEKWSTVIALHFVYASVYIGLVGLFYFSPGVTFWQVVGVSIVVGVHTMCGMHIPLGIANESFNWDWCPTNLLTNKVLPIMQSAIWLILAGFATYAAGPWAGLLVAVTGAVLGLAVVMRQLVFVGGLLALIYCANLVSAKKKYRD